MTVWKRKQIERMTQRKEFAIAALSGIAGHLTGPKERNGETGIQAHARYAWQLADEMMKARNQ